MKIKFQWFALFSILCLSLQAQRKFEKEVSTFGIESLERFKTFLALKNDASNPDDIQKNIDWVQDQLSSKGFETRLLKTSSLPLMVANLNVKAQLPTIAIYMHIDGQAVDPSKWNQEDPYDAVLKKPTSSGFEIVPWEQIHSKEIDELRIFARSASDDKGPFAMLLTALDYLESNKKKPAFNLKLLLDFEEEQSSPGLPELVKTNKEDLAASLLLIFDGPVHATGRPTLVFGNRGIATLTLTTYGPLIPQHSGHYGNYVPNPALALSGVLSSMKDAKGRVLIPDFYKGISIDEATKKVLQAVPEEETSIKERTLIVEPDQVGQTYQESIQYPSLNIRGMQSGWVGKEARTIIPATATAEMDIRLVVESDPVKLIAGVKKHIEDLGFTVLDHAPSKEERLASEKILTMTSKIAYPAFRTDTQAIEGKWLTKIMEDYYGEPPVIIRTSGGSVPISPFVSELNVPAIGVPTVNLDNNQHSPNENLSIKNYLMGIETYIAILTTKF